MTSSALDTTDAFDAAIDSLVLPTAAINSLSPSQIENMKTNVVIANESMETAGNAIKACAAALYDIKVDVKNKNWVALTNSGALDMNGRAARDLVGAYESWLSTTDIPESALAKVTPRMLFKIGKADPGKRVHAINKIKKGDGFTDGDLGKIIGKAKTPIRRQLDDLLDQAELKAKRTSDEDKISKFTDILLENIRLKGRVEELEFKLDRANKALLTATGHSTRSTKAAAKTKAKAAV
tara:strand:+ start:250 stop:963 length:714 start_codon:yes stop_codon:yes gene_type:complete